MSGDYFMKLITFIKSYKLALASVNSKVASWKGVYLGEVTFPENGNSLIKFIFANDYEMKPGALGLSVAFSVEEIERIENVYDGISDNYILDTIDKDAFAREYIKRGEKINEVSRLLIMLEILIKRLQLSNPDTYLSSELTELYFNFDDDHAEFVIDGKSIYTDGVLLLFGD